MTSRDPRLATEAEKSRRKCNPAAHFDWVTELERSHAELRAALLLAGKRIRKLNFGRKDDPLFPILRRTLRDARLVARGVYSIPLKPTS